MASYEGVTIHSANLQEWCRRMAVVINRTLLGKLNTVFTVTLTANAANTTVSVPPGVLTADSYINFMPTTSNAAAALAAGTMYVSARTPLTNQFTIAHANNAQADRTFTYVVIG